VNEAMFVADVIAITGVIKSLVPQVSGYITILVAGALGALIGLLGLVPGVVGPVSGLLWGLAASGAITVAEKVAGTK
jgi:hypothetical protein